MTMKTRQRNSGSFCSAQAVNLQCSTIHSRRCVRSLLGLISTLVFVAVFTTCCGSKKATKDFDASGADKPALAGKVQKGTEPQADTEVAVIETADFGTIVIELYPNLAPQMVERFKKLIHEGFYNGTTFHRLDPELGIIQGGDPLSKDSDPTNDGTGDSPYPNVPGEISDIPFDRGIVGAAIRSGARHMRLIIMDLLSACRAQTLLPA